jgi:hypothetical protein
LPPGWLVGLGCVEVGGAVDTVGAELDWLPIGAGALPDPDEQPAVAIAATATRVRYRDSRTEMPLPGGTVR